jgi:unsaturated rhamnogalacturonyl hydrolase
MEASVSRDADVVRQVIGYTVTHPYERDYWEKAPAISGVLAWNDEAATNAVRRWIDRAVETQTSEGCLSYSDPLDLPAGHVRTFTPTATLSASLGYPLLLIYDRAPEERYLAAAKFQAEAVMNTPRTKDGGFWARREGPELWIDFLYMMCPFLARFGQITKDPRYVDEAFRQYEIHVRYLVDRHAHLARHAWCEVPNHFPQSTLWARGNGWLVACSVDLLALAEDHPKASLVAETCKRALAAMRQHQDRSGFFHHILDDSNTKLEASATVMFAYAAAKAVQLKLIGDDYAEPAVRAWRVVAGSVLDDGAIPGVAVPPGGPGVPFGTTLFGQGFFLLAADALRRELKL